jgi:hypothetical protein
MPLRAASVSRSNAPPPPPPPLDELEELDDAGAIVTCAEPDRVGSAAEVAVIVTVAEEGTAAGAV